VGKKEKGREARLFHELVRVNDPRGRTVAALEKTKKGKEKKGVKN